MGSDSRRGGKPYGTTYQGGASGDGVVYKVDPSGAYTVLYSFTRLADGAAPKAGVIQDSAGNLYGTTSLGGTYDEGVVFKLDPAGIETVLYNFTGHGHGGIPEAPVMLDSAGNLYGTTYTGGASNKGVVFKLDPSGTATVLHNFVGGGTDGELPDTGLIQDAAGNLYGTTSGGGLSDEGVVFRIDTSGNYKLLHSFTGTEDGGRPGELVRGVSGDLYGTASNGGAFNGGVVFKLDATGAVTAVYSFLKRPNGVRARNRQGLAFRTPKAIFTVQPGTAAGSTQESYSNSNLDCP